MIFYSRVCSKQAILFLLLGGKKYNLLEMAASKSCYQRSGGYNLFDAYGQE